MLVDGAREIIANVMTANRSLSQIPSASAILDVSNYTFQAISYGKDADGFRHHAHVILSPSSDGIIKVVWYGNNSASSYQSHVTASALSATYKQYPESPLPTNKRLESKSTLPNYTYRVPDVGQCINAFKASIDQDDTEQLGLYYKAHLVGCFPYASGTQFIITSSVTDPKSNIICSGILSSTYNALNLMDASGFLTFASGNASTHKTLSNASGFSSGALRVYSPNKVTVQWYLPSGDAGGLLLFGGVYHIGLWCLDLKEMLKQGYTPPYSFNSLNNIRKYKLFAKQTFNKDLLYITDVSGSIPVFNSLFTNNDNNGLAWDNNMQAIIFNWDMVFC